MFAEFLGREGFFLIVCLIVMTNCSFEISGCILWKHKKPNFCAGAGFSVSLNIWVYREWFFPPKSSLWGCSGATFLALSVFVRKTIRFFLSFCLILVTRSVKMESNFVMILFYPSPTCPHLFIFVTYAFNSCLVKFIPHVLRSIFFSFPPSILLVLLSSFSSSPAFVANFPHGSLSADRIDSVLTGRKRHQLSPPLSFLKRRSR